MEIRQAEPYSYCQFIMGRDHSAHGRAHHPFMTGSAGWAYYAATRYMLGIRPGFDRLTVDPCIPAAWEGFETERHWRGPFIGFVWKIPTMWKRASVCWKWTDRQQKQSPCFPLERTASGWSRG